ncbi:hypothetical protein L195_g057783, partial [Trifolium pratense]
SLIPMALTMTATLADTTPPPSGATTFTRQMADPTTNLFVSSGPSFPS